MKLSEYLNNKKIQCSTDLIEENWKRLLNSDERILKQINEWKSFNLTIDIGSIYHADSNIRSPKNNRYTNYFYNHKYNMYISYMIQITRNITNIERKQYGNAKGISISFDLPLNMCITVIRADIQKDNRIINQLNE